MKTHLIETFFILTCLISSASLPAQTKAPDKPAVPSKELTVEQRETMAQHHEKMAACLRDKTKALSDCQSEMMASCQAMGPGTCPMMGKGGMGMGRGHR